jgi:hypothetical protein
MDAWENALTFTLTMELDHPDNAMSNVLVNVYLHVLDLIMEMMDPFL